MIITKILKKGELYQIIFLEGNIEKKVKVTEDFMLINKMLKPRKLTEDEKSNINVLLEYENYYIKCINKIKFKIRSTKEIELFLKREKSSNMLIDFVIGKLTKFKYLDDKAFAKAYFSHLIWNKKGPNFIKSEMKKHNIDSNFYNMDEYKEEQRLENLLITIKKELGKYKKGSINNFKNKCLTKMMNKGYNLSNIKKVLSSIDFKEYINESESIKKEYEKLLKKYSLKKEGYELKKKIIDSLLKKGYSYSKIKEYV